MVFPSVSLYPDPPIWQHQARSDHHQVCGGDGSTGGGGTQNPLLPSLPPPHQLGSMGAIRPGSTADRARMARLPPPEAALKCPRCDSSNTKFCYYNNYSLLQPRHFCRTCRRYWTNGGALRNVPVGGGCRRNKRSSKRNRSSSKSPSASNSQPPQMLASDDDANNNAAISVGTASSALPVMFSIRRHHLPPQMEPSDPPFLPALHANYGFTDHIGLTVDAGMLHHASPPGGFDGGGDGFLLGGAGGGPPDEWRLTGKMQHIPFIGGLDYPNACGSAGDIYGLQGNVDQVILPCAIEEGQLFGSRMGFGSGMKMEGSPQQEPNPPAPFLGVNSDSTDFWYVNNKRADLSGGAGASSAAGLFFSKTSA